jgi:hypothetical protein
MRRYLGPTLGVFVLLAVGAGLVRTRPAESAARPWAPDIDALGVAYAGGLGGPGLTGGGASSSSPIFSGDVTASKFFSTAASGSAGLNLKDGATVSWSVAGTGGGNTLTCVAATSNCTLSTTYLNQVGLTMFFNGLAAQSNNQRVNLSQGQTGQDTSFTTNTPDGGTAVLIGTTVSDANAGYEPTTLLAVGTGVVAGTGNTSTNGSVASVKFNVTGAGPQLPLTIGTAGSGTGITVNRSGALQTFVHKVTVAETALTAAATTQDITIWTLAAKTRLTRVVVSDVTGFTGGGLTAMTVACGPTAGTTTYLPAGSIFASSVVLGDAAAEIGTALTNATLADIPSMTATSTISCRFTSTTANVVAATAGSATFYIEGVVYP